MNYTVEIAMRVYLGFENPSVEDIEKKKNELLAFYQTFPTAQGTVVDAYKICELVLYEKEKQ